MITVAKSIEAPIKLVFPRPPPPSAKPGQAYYSMLGLGDIVLPGLMIGLALRFDLYMYYLHRQSKTVASGTLSESKASSESNLSVAQNSEASVKSETVTKAKYRGPTSHSDRFWLTSWTQLLAPRFAGPSRYVETFPKPYFHASLVGYTLGLIATLFSMHIMQHGQPALLYLVPGVLIACWGTAVARGELSVFHNFSEHDDSEAKAGDEKKETKALEEPESEQKPKSTTPNDAETKPSALKASEASEPPSEPAPNANGDGKPATVPAVKSSTADLPHQCEGAVDESPKATKTVRFDLPDTRSRSPGNVEGDKESASGSRSGGQVLFSLTITTPRRKTKIGEEMDTGAAPVIQPVAGKEGVDAPAYVESGSRKRVRLA